MPQTFERPIKMQLLSCVRPATTSLLNLATAIATRTTTTTIIMVPSSKQQQHNASNTRK
jgi:hypothetical protein